jgi:hypothetical protein
VVAVTTPSSIKALAMECEPMSMPSFFMVGISCGENRNFGKGGGGERETTVDADRTDGERKVILSETDGCRLYV